MGKKESGSTSSEIKITTTKGAKSTDKGKNKKSKGKKNTDQKSAKGKKNEKSKGRDKDSVIVVRGRGDKSRGDKVPPVAIGVVDTMFARYDMGQAASDELAICPGYDTAFRVITKTVPGFKDLAVAAMNLIEVDGCSIVVALGMPGSAPIDKQCAHEAAMGIMQAQLLTATPILEVFVHEDEATDPKVLASVFENRSRKHARNAYWMLFEPEQLRRRAGQGVRQGFDDAGPLQLK